MDNLNPMALTINKLFKDHFNIKPEVNKKYTARLQYQSFSGGDDNCGQEVEYFQVDSIEEAKEKASEYTSVYSLTLRENTNTNGASD